MPRSNRRRRGGVPRARDEGPELDLNRAIGGVERREQHGDGEWFVRAVTGAASTRTYRCPGCQQEVVPGTAHLVAWPADGVGGVGERRHWHTPCWRARSHRHPRGSWK